MATPHHCCEQLRAQVEYVCEEHPGAGACPEQLVGFDERFDEYGLWIHSGDDGRAYSWLMITYCPFSGDALPASRRDAWFERLESLGLDDPDAAPDSLRRYGWWELTSET
jgi:hypothetical protein